MLLLLGELTEGGRQWRHGYDLMKATGLFSGTRYPLLMRMTEQGLVEAEWLEPAQTGRPARHAPPPPRDTTSTRVSCIRHSNHTHARPG